MPKPYINNGGTWRIPKRAYINTGGTWRNCAEIWTRRAGVWRKIFEQRREIEVTADTYNLDLFQAAGSPAQAVDIILSISLGVTVGSVSADLPALFASTPFPAGTKLTIINKGTIGGAGGKGGSVTWETHTGTPDLLQDGVNGGTGLELGCNTIIDNSVGNIWGGGGGAGCGKDEFNYYTVVLWAGGGGAGSVPGAGGVARVVGRNSYTSRSGTAAAGGSGYYYVVYPDDDDDTHGYHSGMVGGAPGAPGVRNSDDKTYIAEPGAGGRAITRNGYTLEITAGENAEQLKGAYD